MDDKLYFDRIARIHTHANKLHSYLYVLKSYTDNELDDNNAVANISDILEIAVNEIDAILNYI